MDLPEAMAIHQRSVFSPAQTQYILQPQMLDSTIEHLLLKNVENGAFCVAEKFSIFLAGNSVKIALQRN